MNAGSVRDAYRRSVLITAAFKAVQYRQIDTLAATIALGVDGLDRYGSGHSKTLIRRIVETGWTDAMVLVAGAWSGRLMS